MKRLRPARLVIATAFLAPLAGVLATRDIVLQGTTPQMHAAVVAVGAALLGLGAAIVLAGGVREHDARTVIVGGAFSTMSLVFAIHGLATPGIVTNGFSLVAMAGGLTIPIGAAMLALSAVPALCRPNRVPALLALQAVIVGVVLSVAAVGFQSNALPPVPTAGSDLALALLAVGLVLLALLLRRSLRTYRLTRRLTDLAVGIGLAWLAASLVAAMTVGPGHVAFWLGHAFELAGMGLVAGAVALDLRRASPSRPLTGDLRAAALVREEEAFLGAQMRGLMVRLAEKDEYTERHTRHVAELAVLVGEELGLDPARLRRLAVGGLVHDIGKLAVPDAILNKPAELDDAEFATIKRHPEWGARLLDELGFGSDARELVLNHHERLDGRGYPRNLHALEIDLDARILAVCDVFSALVADRVYRAAWTVERALDLLRAEAGTAYDPACVAALERVLGAAGAAPLRAVA